MCKRLNLFKELVEYLIRFFVCLFTGEHLRNPFMTGRSILFMQAIIIQNLIYCCSVGSDIAQRNFFASLSLDGNPVDTGTFNGERDRDTATIHGLSKCYAESFLFGTRGKSKNVRGKIVAT